MSQRTDQLGALLLSDPSDDDFIEKIKLAFTDLDEVIEKDSIDLSGGILLFFGFYPGPWLDWIPQNPDVAAKLRNEWKIYQMAKTAIRGRRLEAFQEGECYYVIPLDLALWFLKNNIYIHPKVREFLCSKFGNQKKGRPKDSPKVIENIANLFIGQGVKKITQIDLKNTEDPILKDLVNKYLIEGGITSNVNPEHSRIKRRRKTLADNVNKLISLLT